MSAPISSGMPIGNLSFEHTKELSFHPFKPAAEVDLRSNPEAFESNVERLRNERSGSVLNNVSEFFATHPRVVLGLKVLAVAAIVAGLIAASVFTFGAAIPAVVALTSASSTGAAAGAFALLGTGIGLSVSALGTLFIAKLTKMHKITQDNLSDTLTFLTLSIGSSVIITGLFAVSGAASGAKGIVAAKAGLSTAGTVALLGGAAAVVKAFIERRR